MVLGSHLDLQGIVLAEPACRHDARAHSAPASRGRRPLVGMDSVQRASSRQKEKLHENYKAQESGASQSSLGSAVDPCCPYCESRMWGCGTKQQYVVSGIEEPLRTS